ncbi:MAG: hypothetical protein KQH83_02780 [Actinobacteria bacterium]|nr:hypothetical protein [Actinomycetota bacterium]
MRRSLFGRGRRLRGNWVVTAALVVVAAGLVVWAGFLILDRTAIDDDGGTGGAIPEELPDDFPIPVGAGVGDPSFDPETGEITLKVVTAGTVVDAVSAHTVGLVSAGYVVETSAASGDGWLIAFNRLNLEGTIEVSGDAGMVTSLVTVRRFAPPSSG